MISFLHESPNLYFSGQLTVFNNTKEMRHWFKKHLEFHQRLVKLELHKEWHNLEEKSLAWLMLRDENVTIYLQRSQIIDWPFKPVDTIMRWNRGKLYKNLTSYYHEVERPGMEKTFDLSLDFGTCKEVECLKNPEGSIDAFRGKDKKLRASRTNLAVEVAFLHFYEGKSWPRFSIEVSPHCQSMDIYNMNHDDVFIIRDAK